MEIRKGLSLRFDMMNEVDEEDKEKEREERGFLYRDSDEAPCKRWP